MEISKELIEKHNLSEDVVRDLSDYGANIIATEKQSMGNKANEDAENILTGYVKSIQSEYGVNVDRNQGEKVKDWASRALPEVFKTKLGAKQQELEKLKSDYESKVANAGAGDLDKIKAEFKEEKDTLLKKYADYDTIKEQSEKANAYETELLTLRRDVAFGKVMPQFPESLNPYEKEAKWKDFQERFDQEYLLGFDNNKEPLYISKENEHRKGKLKDLVAKDTQIQDLLKGRQQQGLGSKDGFKQVDGIPFKIKDGISLSEQVREYLTVEKNIPFISNEYSNEYSKMMKEIKQKTAA